MFGYTLIQTSELDTLKAKHKQVLQDSEMIRQRNYGAERSMRWEVDNLKGSIVDLEEEVLKYKNLYLAELEKRLELAKTFRENEVKVED